MLCLFSPVIISSDCVVNRAGVPFPLKPTCPASRACGNLSKSPAAASALPVSPRCRRLLVPAPLRHQTWKWGASSVQRELRPLPAQVSSVVSRAERLLCRSGGSRPAIARILVGAVLLAREKREALYLPIICCAIPTNGDAARTILNSRHQLTGARLRLRLRREGVGDQFDGGDMITILTVL